MKYLGLILVVALLVGQILARRINENDSQLKHLRTKRGLSDKFRNYLENLKTTLREGNETLGIPKVDPFARDTLDLEFDEQYLKGSAKLNNFEVLGLADYKVNKAEIGVFSSSLTIGLTWPRIYSKGSYNLDVLALNKIEVYGQGEYEVTATNLSFQSVVSLKLIGGVAIKSMNTKISLGGLALSVTGLFDDDDVSAIVSETVSDMVPQLLKDYQNQVTTIVNEKIMAFANKKLEGKTISDILTMIG